MSRLSAALLLIFLSGCIRYDETIEVDEYGRGSATLVLSRPTEQIGTLPSEIQNRFSKAAMEKDLPSGVRMEQHESQANKRAEITTVYTFDDVDKLIAWAARKDSPLNNISFARSHGTLTFTRRFPPDKAAFESARNFPDAKFSFKFTGPGSIQTNNATRVEGNTAIWEYTAPELFSGKNLAVSYTFGTPAWVCAAAGAGVLLAAFVIYAILKHNRKVRST